MARNQLRAQMAVLQLALDFAELGTDPRRFIKQPLSGKDGGAWTKAGQKPPDPLLQKEVKALLQTLIDGGDYQTDVTLHFDIKRQQGSIVLTRAARKERDLFVYRLLRLLEDVGIERLRACPECGRLFLKVTRKEFCSTRCQARVNMRNQRRNQRLREQGQLKRKESGHGKATRSR